MRDSGAQFVQIHEQAHAHLAATLRRNDQSRTEFLAVLAHEMRQPLGAMSNAIHLLKASHPEDPRTERALGTMERQMQIIQRMVEDLMDAARLGQGKIEIQPKQLSLEAAMVLAADTVRPMMERNDHVLTVSPPSETLYVNADPTRLEQILVNLLTNAAKYTPPGGRVSLLGARDDGGAVLRVRDTGIGITPKMLPYIFDMFSQVDGSPAASAGGLGVGLAVVKRLVEMHGGRIDAASQGLGRGSEFTVWLPLLPEGEAPPDLPTAD